MDKPSPVDSARTYELRKMLQRYVAEIPTEILDRWIERAMESFIEGKMRTFFEKEARVP